MLICICYKSTNFLYEIWIFKINIFPKLAGRAICRDKDGRIRLRLGQMKNSQKLTKVLFQCAVFWELLFFIFQVHINKPVCSIPNLCAHSRSENDDCPNKESQYDLLFSQNFKKPQFESLSSASRSNSQISDLSDFNLSDTGKFSSTYNL